MGDRSLIEWTDASWNPWRGCDKVSPGCAHCYMFRDQRRYGRDPSVVVRAADPTFYAPERAARWTRQREEIERLEGRRMRVFTCSWSDFFHPEADAWRGEAWDLIRRNPEYDWQILTKRPGMVADRLPADWGEGWPHVWLGVSIENRRFVERADQLRDLPAAVRFVSAEPLLGPLIANEFTWCHPESVTWHWEDDYTGPELDFHNINWLIVGGESGPRYRPLNPEWVRDLRDRCEARNLVDPGLPDTDPTKDGGTAFFFKQWGGPRPDSGGRELDGRTWSEFPSADLPMAVATREESP